MVSNGIQSFTFYHYADGMIEWTTADKAGIDVDAVPAHVGYDAGDKTWYHNIQASGTPSIINITGTSNVAIEGIWAFRLDEEEIPQYTNISKKIIF